MSIFDKEFSSGMAPSVSEKTVREFQQAHGLVHGFINSRGRLTAENVDDAVRECFKAVQESFSTETRADHKKAVRQFVKNAKSQLKQLRDEIESTQESASQLLRSKRDREIEPEESPQAKKHKDISDRFLELFDSPEAVQECYSQLSPTSFDIIEQLGETEMRDGFFAMLNQVDHSSLQNTVFGINLFSEVYYHIRSFPNPPNEKESCQIACRAASGHTIFLLKGLYPEEEPNVVLKRFLQPETIGMIGKGPKSGDIDVPQFDRLVLAGNSIARFNALSRMSCWTLVLHFAVNSDKFKEFREFLSHLSLASLETMKQISEGPYGQKFLLKTLDAISERTGADPHAMAQLIHRVSEIFLRIRSNTSLSAKSFFINAFSQSFASGPWLSSKLQRMNELVLEELDTEELQIQEDIGKMAL